MHSERDSDVAWRIGVRIYGVIRPVVIPSALWRPNLQSDFSILLNEFSPDWLLSPLTLVVGSNPRLRLQWPLTSKLKSLISGIYINMKYFRTILGPWTYPTFIKVSQGQGQGEGHPKVTPRSKVISRSRDTIKRVFSGTIGWIEIDFGVCAWMV